MKYFILTCFCAMSLNCSASNFTTTTDTLTLKDKIVLDWDWRKQNNKKGTKDLSSIVDAYISSTNIEIIMDDCDFYEYYIIDNRKRTLQNGFIYGSSSYISIQSLPIGSYYLCLVNDESILTGRFSIH